MDVTKTQNGTINGTIHGMKVSSLVDLSWLLKDRNMHVIPLALQSEQTIYAPALAPAAYQCSLTILLQTKIIRTNQTGLFMCICGSLCMVCTDVWYGG